MRGRKPTPTVKRLLAGNPHHRPINAEEPKPPPVTAEFDAIPVELADHADAITEWKRLAPMLRHAGQITLADRSALIACCLAWDQFLDATRVLKRDGLIATVGNHTRPSPYIQIAKHAIAAATRLWSELGLTPTARVRLKVTPLAPGDDPFTEFDQPGVQ